MKAVDKFVQSAKNALIGFYKNGDYDRAADYLITYVERIKMLSDRIVTEAEREAAIQRIWAIYAEMQRVYMARQMAKRGDYIPEQVINAKRYGDSDDGNTYTDWKDADGMLMVTQRQVYTHA